MYYRIKIRHQKCGADYIVVAASFEEAVTEAIKIRDQFLGSRIVSVAEEKLNHGYV